jgi:hypothetical protein
VETARLRHHSEIGAQGVRTSLLLWSSTVSQNQIARSLGFSGAYISGQAARARHREISVCMELRGGAGRTRTSNQTIISR